MATATRDYRNLDPFLNFRFKVMVEDIGSAGFSDVTIPDSTVEAVEYREGFDINTVRMLSGRNNSGNITLKRGITTNYDIWNWFQSVEKDGSLNHRKGMSIMLIGEEGSGETVSSTILAQWDITDAWPVKYEPSELSALGNDIMIETLEITHEGIKRKNDISL